MIEPQANDGWLANVKIKGDDSGRAIMEIDGKPVKGLVGYKIEHNASDKRAPLLTLQVMCNLEMDTGAIPLLPEPWNWFYKPIVDGFTDGHDLPLSKPLSR